VTKWLEHSSLVQKVLGSKHTPLMHRIFQKLSVHPAIPDSLDLGEDKDSEEDEWRPTTVTPLLVQVGSLAATSPSHAAITGYEPNLYPYLPFWLLSCCKCHSTLFWMFSYNIIHQETLKRFCLDNITTSYQQDSDRCPSDA